MQPRPSVQRKVEKKLDHDKIYLEQLDIFDPLVRSERSKLIKKLAAVPEEGFDFEETRLFQMEQMKALRADRNLRLRTIRFRDNMKRQMSQQSKASGDVELGTVRLGKD